MTGVRPHVAPGSAANRRSKAAPAGVAFVGLFVLSVLAFAVLLPLPRADGELIGSDGVAYYVFVRSLVIDHDLRMADEFDRFRRAFPATPEVTATGLVGNKFAVGPAVLWLPFFIVAHAVAVAAAALGLGTRADGYGYLYQAAVCVGSIAYGVAGLWFAYRCGRRVIPGTAVLLAAMVFWATSNAIYYSLLEPTMAHMVSLFATSVLLSTWFCWLTGGTTLSLRRATAIGAAAGLVLLVRLQDAPALLLPFGLFVAQALGTARAREWSRLGRQALAGVVAVLAALIVFSPQLVVWHALYGHWLALPYLAEHDPPFYWLSPRLGDVLFSSYHGLIAWHPVYLAAVIGLLMLVRRSPGLGWPLLAVVGVSVYVVGAWWSWWQGDAFGGRMFLSLTWVWVLGLAALTHRVSRRPRGAAVAGGVVAALLVWNALSVVQYRLGLVPPDRPLTLREMTVDRLSLPWRLTLPGRVSRRGAEAAPAQPGEVKRGLPPGRHSNHRAAVRRRSIRRQ